MVAKKNAHNDHSKSVNDDRSTCRPQPPSGNDQMLIPIFKTIVSFHNLTIEPVRTNFNVLQSQEIIHSPLHF